MTRESRERILITVGEQVCSLLLALSVIDQDNRYLGFGRHWSVPSEVCKEATVS